MLAVMRMEQLYPFPREQVLDAIALYPNLKEVVWVQEEAKNMGAWDFAEPRFRETLPENLAFSYIGRKPAASPAVGSHHVHDIEQEALVKNALT